MIIQKFDPGGFFYIDRCESRHPPQDLYPRMKPSAKKSGIISRLITYAMVIVIEKEARAANAGAWRF